MSTYEPIASQTLGSAAASVTFSSIPQGYTDLVLVGNLGSASAYYTSVRFNSDTGSNYSVTNLWGNGSSAASDRGSNRAVGDISYEVTLPSGVSSNFIANIMNYSNSTTYKTTLTRMNNAANGVSATAVLWRNTSPITSITILSSASNGSLTANIDSGSTFSLYGIQVGTAAQKAQGGNIVTSDGTYVYHTFTSSGSFTTNQALTVDYLVVAGGGGGGCDNAGGGGAGGLRCTVGATGGGGSLESALSLSSGKSYVVAVGAGGAGAPTSSFRGTNGSDSVFASITSSGGGGGGSDVAGVRTGLTGGSGGGGNGNGSSAGGSGTANQGYAGGTGYILSSTVRGGGGGGAGAVGTTPTASVAANGGAGVTTSISGTSVTYAGGGGGGTQNATAGAGGTGGGGAGQSTGGVVGGAGTLNTGGGGGGSATTGAGAGGAGGSGIVIIRYAV